MNSARTHFVLAVVGGSGAGKTWFVRRLCSFLGEHASHLALDDFYRDRSHLSQARRARINFDVPHAIDWQGAAQVLRDCRAGLPTAVPRYDFASHCRVAAPAPWQPRPVTVVEGLWLLRSPELRRLFDLSIYLDTPDHLRRQRRLARDTAERGYTADAVHDRLTRMVLPMHQRYVEPQKRRADLVLHQPYREDEVHALSDRLWALLGPSGVLPCWMHESLRAELTSQLVPHEYCV